MRLLLRVAAGILACSLPWVAQTPGEKEKEPEIPERNPFDSTADAELGRKYFSGHCAFCHGSEGEGGRGVNLTTGQFRHGGSDRALFKTIRSGVKETEMPGIGLAEKEVWRLVAFVRRLGTAGAEEKAPGDPIAGRAVYQKGNCAQCHVVDREGGNVGPELSEIGLRRALKFLRESIIDPSAHVAPNYRAATVTTRKGEQIPGVILNEDDYSIQIRDMRDNLRSFWKSDLKVVKKETASLMPPYKSLLSPKEIENLVAYLSSLRGKKSL